MNLRNFGFIFLIIATLFVLFVKNINFSELAQGAPPYATEDLEPPQDDIFYWLKDWKRPDGPPRVGLQAGHWKNSELPEELERLKGNSGSSGGGKSEWEVNKIIAEFTAEILRSKGVVVDILPSTIPEKYWADVFVAIHADGSIDHAVSGFKTAIPRRDLTGKAGILQSMIETDYERATGLTKDPNVSRNMRGYYAFAWWRYSHAVHPMSVPLIIETGFLTSPQDRKIIVKNPGISAEGIAAGIINYLGSEQLLE